MLENIEIFSWLNSLELDTFKMFCQERTYSQWDVIFSKWEDATAMYVVKSWELEVVDDFRVLWTVEPGNIVWEMAIFWANKTRSATVKAKKDTVLIVILKFSIDDLIKKHPQIFEKIKNVIDNRVEKNSK